MKLLLLLLGVSTYFSISTFAQDNSPAKVSRIKIYGTKAELGKIRQAGIDFDHGVYDIEKATFINEFNIDDVKKIKALGFKFDVLVDNVFAYTDSLNKIQDPYMYENLPVNVEPKLDAMRMYFTSSCTNYDTYVTTPSTFSLGSRGGFYTLAELEAEIDEMVSDYPGLVTKSSIGNTFQGRPIWVVKISDNAASDESEPEMLFTGMHHAREGMSMMNLIYFMRYLLENYASNSAIKEIVNSRELFFIPVVNIDGFNYNTTLSNWNAGRRMRRKNMQETTSSSASSDGSAGDGVDINRNYGTYWGTSYSNGNTASSNLGNSDAYRGSGAFSEVETQHMRDFINGRNFKMAINYHCYGNWWIRPQGPDDGVYSGITLSSTDVGVYNSIAALFTKYNCFVYGTPVQTVYDVNGYSDDWTFSDPSHSKIYSFSPEIGSAGDGFWCPQAKIIPYAKQLLFSNLQAAYTAGSYAELQDNSDIGVTGAGSFGYTVTRKGFADSSITVTWIPLTANVQSAAPSYTINSIAAFGGTYTGSIAYTLVGTVPAGSVIKYAWQVKTGGVTITDTVIKIYSPSVLLQDDMETSANFANNWVRSSGSSWGYMSADGFSNSYSLTESPSGNYTNSADQTVKLKTALNLSSSIKAYASYLIKYNTENCQDRLQVEIATDGVNGTYNPICTQLTISESGGSLGGNAAMTGSTMGWVRDIIDLSPYAGNNNVGLRFRFLSNSTNEPGYGREGFSIDNFKVIKTSAITLPVHFTDIFAVRQGEKVQVNWKAETDDNFSYYEIERSVDGIRFTSIVHTTDRTASTAIDNSPVKGHNYYRVKAVDADGSYRLSKTVLVVFESSTQVDLYPNPATDKMTVGINSDHAGKLTLEVANMVGQIIYSKEVILSKGYNTQEVNTSRWKNQLYVVKLRDDAGNVIKNFKLVKK